MDMLRSGEAGDRGHPQDERNADAATRTKALIGLFVALLLAVLGWFGLTRATDSGIARLAAIDRGRAACERGWRAARTKEDTMAVDRTALADTVDARSDQALMECGDLRDKGTAGTVPNAREMNGEPMPRGLR